MEIIKGVTTLTERLECGIDIPEPQMEAPREESLFFELFKPSMGESIANHIIVMRDPYSSPKPTQRFIELVESIVDRYNAGEWTTTNEKPAKGALSLTGTPTEGAGVEPTSIAYINKKPEGSGTAEQSIEELYHEGTLLYAMYPPPEEKDYTDHLERYHNEGYIMGQAIDAFLEHATSEEREAFIALSREEQ